MGANASILNENNNSILSKLDDNKTPNGSNQSTPNKSIEREESETLSDNHLEFIKTIRGLNNENFLESFKSEKENLTQTPIKNNHENLTPNTDINKDFTLNHIQISNDISIYNSVLAPKTNKIFDDYFISNQVLGLGLNGEVFRCKNKINKKKYAVKTLLCNTSRDFLKAKREIDLHWRASQGCPYIVKIIDVYENTIDKEKYILVIMELMEGGELFNKIKEQERTEPFTEQAKMMHQICSAVKHLHSMNIAHRDLKPENLLLTTNDDTGVIKLTDFGFAKEVNLGLETPVFTPYYVAPEILGSNKYDISCDIWSLGVIMYILCCGRPPFFSINGLEPFSPGMKDRIKAGKFSFPKKEWSRISDDAKELIKGMLETTPEKRITIDDIVKSRWISQYFSVPETPLNSLDILKEGKDQWLELQENIKTALHKMRIDYDIPKIKELSLITDNRILKKRLNDKIKTNANNIDQLIVEKNQANLAENETNKINRTISMISAESITPTNSQP